MSLWYKSIPHIGPYDFLQAVNSNFSLERTVQLQYIRYRETDDKRTQHSSISATVSTVG